MSERISPKRRAAERLLLRAAGGQVSRAVPGSVTLSNWDLDWTENFKGSPHARSAHVDGESLLDLLVQDLAS